MKAHLAKVSLALLSTVFLFGCQDMGSGPMGPEGLGPEFNKPPHDHGDKGDPEQSTLTLADGIQATALPVTVKWDRDDKFRVNNTDFMHNIQMTFTDLGTCVGFKGTKSGVLPSPEQQSALEAELTSNTVTEGFFVMQIDRTSLDMTSDDHGLLVQFEETSEGPLMGTSIRIMLGSPFSQVDPVKVTENNPVFTFTGPIVVWAHGVGGGGGAKSDRIIQCPGTGNDPNKVVATINP